MPTPSSSFESIVPLPPRVVAIRNAIFEAPDETGESVAVPTTYSLYTAADEPNIDVGDNGDWYIWVTLSTIKTYRKVTGFWTLVSTITGGGGGGGGDISGVTISNCLFENGTITGTTISTSALVAPTVTGGVFAGPVITTPSITGGTMTSTIVTGLPTPVLPSDAVTKSYVDGVAQGLTVHEAVVAGTVGANITLAGGAPNTLDGEALTANDRLLVKDQTNPIENGIYYVSTLGTGANGTWTRATDADTGNELDSAYVLVQFGTANGGSSWVVSGTPLIGTDAVIWTQFFAITSIPASIITGSITAGQIGSVNAGAILGTITAGQIGTITAGQISGTITASQIGSVNAGVIAGTITSSQIGSVSATVISGSITAAQVGSINANTIVGVITTNQLVDQILNTQRLIASDISVVKRVAALPVLPNSDYPLGALVLNTTNKTLYQNVAGAWSVVTASSNVVGTLTSNDIASVNASSIVGLIIASQIGSVNASSLVGSISSSQIGSVNASAITGSITASQIGSVNAAAITGSITSSQIASVTAGSITGTITSGQIASVNATTITLGSLSAINYTMPGSNSSNTTTINSSGLTVGVLTINGATNQNTISFGGFNPLTISGGQASASIGIGPSAAGRIVLTYSGSDQISIQSVGTLGSNGSGRYAMSSSGTTSIAFSTNGTERWFIGGSDGHLKSNGYRIMKASSDGWTPLLFDGTHTIEFQWSGGLYARIDGSSTIGPF